METQKKQENKDRPLSEVEKRMEDKINTAPPASDLSEVMKKNIILLAEEYFAIVLNHKTRRIYGSNDENRIINAFEKIIHQLPLVNRDIKAETVNDVVDLIGKGKLTLSEAKELMGILQIKFEITELKDIEEKLEAMAKVD